MVGMIILDFRTWNQSLSPMFYVYVVYLYFIWCRKIKIMSSYKSSSASKSKSDCSSTSSVWKTRPIVPDDFKLLCLDAEFFCIKELHKLCELNTIYDALLDREMWLDEMRLRCYAHRSCSCCIRMFCPTCHTFILYEKNDPLCPYCHSCEKFLSPI